MEQAVWSGPLSPVECAKIGRALAALSDLPKIGIACAQTRFAKTNQAALEAGCMGGGMTVWNFGTMLRSGLLFAASFCSMELCVYLDDTLTLYGKRGQSLAKETLAALQETLEDTSPSREPYGTCVDMSGVSLLYQRELLSAAPQGLSGLKAIPKCRNPYAEQLFDDALTRLGCDTHRGDILTLSPDGTSVTLSGEAYTLSFSDILLLCCEFYLKEGRDIVVSAESPAVIDLMAKKYQRQVVRSSTAIQWQHDGMQAAVMLLAFCRAEGVALSELRGLLPYCSATLDCPSPVVHTPVTLQRETGSIRLKPDGEKLRIYAEAASFEAAKALCDEVTERVRRGADVNFT